MNRTKLMLVDGKGIFFMDYSNLQTEPEIKVVIEQGRNFIRKQALGSVLSLADITDMHFNTAIKDLFQDLIKGNKPYMKASAIVGVTGLRQIVLNGVLRITGREVRSFNDIEQAKKWLCSHK